MVDLEKLAIGAARPDGSSASMRELAALTDLLRAAIPSGKRVGYVDYPMHGNVGDLLIYLGALDFFKANGNEIASSFCIFDAGQRAFASLADCDVIACHGGGNFGDIYPAHQNLREEIARRFPNKPVVIMPQSFHFGSDEALRRSAEHFRRHPNLTIAVRDRHSERLARTHFSDKVMLVPDMAHRLYDRFEPIRNTPGRDPLHLMRRDVEATNATRDAGHHGRDWSDLLPLGDKMAIGRYRAASIVAGRLNLTALAIQQGHQRVVQRVIDDLARRLVAHDPWTTSRLHGAIFGLLLGRQVTLHDNSYGKNSRYFSEWGKEIDNLRLQLPDPEGTLDHAADLDHRALLQLDLKPVDQKTWHRAIADFDELSQDQLASFAMARGTYQAVEPVLFTSAGEIVGGALMVIRPMPILGNLASTHWGPILRRRSADAAALRAAMVDALAGEYGDRRRMMVSIWAPPLYDGNEATQAIALHRGYRKGRSWPDPFIYVLDLAQDEDQMHKNLLGKWRSHLNKAVKSELTFEAADVNALAEMDRLYTEMLARKSFSDRTPYHTLKAIMQTDEPTLRPRLFFVRKGETILAGAVVFTAGTQAHYLYGASADAALPVNAGHFLQWNIARWLKANTRARWYNLGAADGVPGLVTFKSGLAGKTAHPVPVPTSIDYAASPITSFAGRAMFKLRDRLRVHTASPRNASVASSAKQAY